MIEKPSPENAPTNLAIIGRYILTPNIFDIIKGTKPSNGGEIQIIDTEIYPIKNRVTNGKKSSTYFLDNKYNENKVGESKNTFYIEKDKLLYESKNISKFNLEMYIESWNEKLH